MSAKNQNEFWALLRLGVKLGRRTWRPRCVDVRPVGVRARSGRAVGWTHHDGRRPIAYEAGGRSQRSAVDFDLFLQRLVKEGPRRWTGLYGNFRKVSRFSALGFKWDLIRDGVVNDGGDRELDFLVQSRTRISPADWRRLKRARFFEKLAELLHPLGYRIALSARRHGGRPFMLLSKPLRWPDLRRDVAAHLSWRPPHPDLYL